MTDPETVLESNGEKHHESEKKDINEALEEILAEMGCKSYAEVPKGKKTEVLEKLLNMGYSVEEISKAVNMEPSRVKSIIARHGSKGEKDNEKKTVVIKEKDDLEEFFKVDMTNPYPEYIPYEIEYRGETYTPQELVSEFGKSGLDYLKYIVLEKILKDAPTQIGERTINKILTRFRRDPSIRDNMRNLVGVLQEYRIPASVIREVIEVIGYIDNTFRQYIKQYYYIYPPATPMPPQEEFVFGAEYGSHYDYERVHYWQNPNPNPWSTSNPYPNPYPQHQFRHPPSKHLTADDVRNIVKEVLSEYEEEKKKKSLEERIERLEEAVSKIIKYLEDDGNEREKKQNPLEGLEQRIAALEAKLASLKPAGSGEEEDPKIKIYKDLVNDLKEEIKSLRASYEALKDKLHEERVKSLEDKIKTLEDSIKNSSSNLTKDSLELAKLRTQEQIERIKADNLRKAISDAKEMVREISRAVGRGVGESFFLSTVGRAGFSNLVRVGNKLKGVCPKCGADIEAPLDATTITCPSCKSQLAIKEAE